MSHAIVGIHLTGTPKIHPAPHRGGGEHSSRGLPGEAMPSKVKVKVEEPPRALREVDRLTRNPEKLANSGGRCWKDILRAKEVTKTHRYLYPTRLVTAWKNDQETLMKWNQTQK